jgi:hypothetical protein
VDWVLTDDGTLTISGNSNMYAGSEFNPPWNRYMDQIRSVVINEGVSNIEAHAFSLYENLTSITIPEGLTSIGRSALGGCVNLTSIHIPASVESIGHWAFSSCGHLEKITVRSASTEVAESAFQYNGALKTVINLSGKEIKAGSSDYGYAAAYTPWVFTSVDEAYEDYLFTEGDFVFFSKGDVCSLEEYRGEEIHLTLPASFQGKNYAIGAYVFEYSDVVSIVIPSGVTEIGAGAFSRCSSLSEIVYLGTPDEWNSLRKYLNWDYAAGKYTLSFEEKRI